MVKSIVRLIVCAFLLATGACAPIGDRYTVLSPEDRAAAELAESIAHVNRAVDPMACHEIYDEAYAKTMHIDAWGTSRGGLGHAVDGGQFCPSQQTRSGGRPVRGPVVPETGGVP